MPRSPHPRDPSLPAFSVTALMTYETCPRQYERTFVQRLPPPVTPAMRRGTNIHALIAAHLQQPSLLPPPLDDEALPLWNTFIASRFNRPPVAVERPFALPFDGGTVAGRLDALYEHDDGALEVVDFKSGRSWAEGRAENLLQLPIYALVTRRERDVPPEAVSGSYFFLRDGRESRVQLTGERERTLIARIERVIDGISRGQFAPTPGCACFACRPGSRAPLRLSTPR